MAHSDYTAMERLLSTRYPVTKIYGAANVLRDIHTLREQRFQGTDTTLLSCILIDFERLVEKARLTKRQREALYFHFELDLTQAEVAEIMDISQQAVSKHIDNAIAKIVVMAKEEDSKKNENTL